MKREFEFAGSSCSRCERLAVDGEKQQGEIVWSVNCYRNGENKYRLVGWMTQATIEQYAKKGRVYMSNSSTHCPPCQVDFLGSASLEEEVKKIEADKLREDPNPNWFDICEEVLLGFRQWDKYLEKNK